MNVVVYVVNISAYDQFLGDKNYKKNCLLESMELFSSICHEKTFIQTDFVIFFNKIDEFNKKIESIPFTVFDPSFNINDSHNSQSATNYLIEQFTYRFNYNSLHEKEKKYGNLYFHEVNDSNSDEVGILLQKVQTDVITSTMKRMGYAF